MPRGLSAVLLAIGVWTGVGGVWPEVRAQSSSPAADPAGSAGGTAAAKLPLDTPSATLDRALELERKRQWSPAIELYEAAARRWPGNAEFRHRLRLCEAHFRLGRRYQDPSFRKVLLPLGREQALALLDEVLERIETHYVDAVSFVPLMRLGLDNLEVALRDPVFLQANAQGADPDRVKWLRQSYQALRDTLTVRSRAEARQFVSDACDLGRRGLGLPPAAVALEFIYGSCDALDDYSNYLSPDKLDDLYAVIDGNFVGLGVELKGDPKGLLLVGVIPGGPAAEAGLTAGEILTEIDDHPIAGQGLDEAASKLQGVEGTNVSVVVLGRDGTRRSVSMRRRQVEVVSVQQARIVDRLTGVGYLQLTGFQKTSTDELRRSIGQLQHQGMKFLVLDLRGNPGGLLDVAVEIADGFLDQGVIVSTRGRAGNQNAVYRAAPGSLWKMPLAVLVDHDSASASEILAGALKDNRRAVVIGEQSYGKGSVQSIFPLRSVPAGLKLTTAKFYSPTNRSYSEQGVEPDVAVRVAAKPAGNAPAGGAIELGNPEKDPVLERAITQARRVLSVSR
jgi:carboxyl-terminal processing protease